MGFRSECRRVAEGVERFGVRLASPPPRSHPPPIRLLSARASGLPLVVPVGSLVCPWSVFDIYMAWSVSYLVCF